MTTPCEWRASMQRSFKNQPRWPSVLVEHPRVVNVFSVTSISSQKDSGLIRLIARKVGQYYQALRHFLKLIRLESTLKFILRVASRLPRTSMNEVCREIGIQGQSRTEEWGIKGKVKWRSEGWISEWKTWTFLLYRNSVPDLAQAALVAPDWLLWHRALEQLVEERTWGSGPKAESRLVLGDQNLLSFLQQLSRLK